MAHYPLINTAEYERSIRFVDEYDLAAHNPALALQLRSVNTANPTGADVLLWNAAREHLAHYERYHQDNPFRTATREALHVDGITVLHQVANNQPLTLQREELARNVLITGGTGAGKTSILLNLTDAALQDGLQVWTFDIKGDAPRLAVRHDHMLVAHPDAPIDLLAKPPYLSTPEHITNIVEKLARATYGGQGLRAITHETFTHLFTKHDHPSVHDAITHLAALPRKGDTYDRQNAINNLRLRLQRLIERYPGMARPDGMPAYQLCEQAVLFPLVTMSDVEEFLVSYLVTHLFHHHRAKNIRALRTLIAFDEGLLLFRGEGGTSRISGNSVAELLALTREYGIGWALSVNAAHLLEPSIPSNVFALIALNASSNQEADFVSRHCGLSKEQLAFYRLRLTRGQAVVRFADRYRHPMLATVQPWPHQKTVTNDEWRATLRRIDAFLPPSPSGTTQQTPTAAPTERSDDEPTTGSSAPRRIALNTHETTLLNYVSTNVVILTSEAIHDLGLHPQAFARAKKKLLKLHLATEERIRCRAGRGASAVALLLTTAGLAQASKKGTHQTRGNDSAQHRYLALRLARAIPDAQVEVTIGTKSIDVVIPYNATKHAILRDVVPTLIALNDGALVAIEVELHPEKTLLNNLAKNRAAGIAHNIIAVMPEALAAARRLATSADTTALDVLLFLDTLRSAS